MLVVLRQRLKHQLHFCQWKIVARDIEGRGDRTDNVPETVDATHLEKTETGKGVFNRNVLNKVEETIMSFTK